MKVRKVKKKGGPSSKSQGLISEALRFLLKAQFRSDQLLMGDGDGFLFFLFSF